MAEPEVTVAEMLRRIEAGRSELDGVLASRPSVGPGEWSAKDHMAHIAVWERSALALLNGEERYAHVGVSMDEHAALGTDGINERAFAMYRDRPLEEVQALYDQAHADLLNRLKSMSDTDLELPYSHYQPDDPPYNADPVWPWIVGNTFEHYKEHAEILQTAAR